MTGLFLTKQCIVTCVICWICGLLGERRRDGKAIEDKKNTSKLTAFLVTFPRAEYKPVTAMKVMPLSFVFVLMIVFNQLTLKYVHVSFYNVAR